MDFVLIALGVVIGLGLVFVARGKVADPDTKQAGTIMLVVGFVFLIIAAYTALFGVFG